MPCYASRKLRERARAQSLVQGPVIEANVHSSVAAVERAPVVMQIAKVRVPHVDVSVNVFFDTYVTTDAVRLLRPRFVRAERLSYSAFGQHERSDLCQRNLFSIQLQGLDSIETIESTEVPVICAPIQRRTVPKELLKVSGVDPDTVCSSTDPNVKIDVLIGLDYYWRLVGTQSKMVADGLALQKTKFGYMFSGAFESASENADSVIGLSLLSFDLFSKDSLSVGNWRRSASKT
jgi:soluble P-type ATPase